MSNKPNNSRLFSYRTKNYADGTHQETEWNIGNTAISIAIALIMILADIPHGKMTAILNFLKIFAK